MEQYIIMVNHITELICNLIQYHEYGTDHIIYLRQDRPRNNAQIKAYDSQI